MQNPQAIQMELNKWMGYLNYGQYHSYVIQQCTALMQTFPQFKPVVESMQFPGDPSPCNVMIFKGQVSL